MTECVLCDKGPFRSACVFRKHDRVRAVLCDKGPCTGNVRRTFRLLRFVNSLCKNETLSARTYIVIDTNFLIRKLLQTIDFLKQMDAAKLRNRSYQQV